MMTKWGARWSLLIAWGCFVAPFAGCAQGVSPPLLGEGGRGEGGTFGTGGEDEPMDGKPCAEDCTAIKTPQCLASVCDHDIGHCAVIPSPSGIPCDDGLFCTTDEQCHQGICKGGKKNDCGMNAPSCSVIQCDELSKTCSVSVALNGTPCPPDGPCSVSASCKNGACVSTLKSCYFAPVPDDCHVAVCNPVTGECEPVPGNEGNDCEGGDPCMSNKTCSGGVCQGGTTKDCSAAVNGCNEGLCDPSDGKCITKPISVGDSCAEAADECNTGICDANGTCVPVPTDGVACASRTDQCNAGLCDNTGKCIAVTTNEGAPCDDGNACTTGETCTAGACIGGENVGYTIFFEETFANNSAAWQLDDEWQIGPAKASNGNVAHGHEDPAIDHTATSDNGIAGVMIGGYASTTIHPAHYLTSPPIDVNVQGPVHLEFFRWLNSDYAPYMINTVDVFDGTTWVNLWTSGSSPAIEDAAWTRMNFDVTAYKNAVLQVRFGVEVGAVGGFTVSSWNVDDVRLVSLVCN